MATSSVNHPLGQLVPPPLPAQPPADTLDDCEGGAKATSPVNHPLGHLVPPPLPSQPPAEALEPQQGYPVSEVHSQRSPAAVSARARLAGATHGLSTPSSATHEENPSAEARQLRTKGGAAPPAALPDVAAAGVPSMKDLLSQWDSLVGRLDSLRQEACRQTGEAPPVKPLGRQFREARRAGGHAWALSEASDVQADAVVEPAVSSAHPARAAPLTPEAVRRYLRGCRLDERGNLVSADGTELAVDLGTAAPAAPVPTPAPQPTSSAAPSSPKKRSPDGASSMTRVQRWMERRAKEADVDLTHCIFAGWRLVAQASRSSSSDEMLGVELRLARERAERLAEVRRSRGEKALAFWRGESARIAVEACFATWRDAMWSSWREQRSTHEEASKTLTAVSSFSDDTTTAALEEALAKLGARTAELQEAQAGRDAEATAARAARDDATAARTGRDAAERAAAAARQEHVAARMEVEDVREELERSQRDTKDALAKVAALQEELRMMQAALMSAREEVRRADAEAKVAQYELMDLRASGTFSGGHNTAQRALMTGSQGLGGGTRERFAPAGSLTDFRSTAPASPMRPPGASSTGSLPGRRSPSGSRR